MIWTRSSIERRCTAQTTQNIVICIHTFENLTFPKRQESYLLDQYMTGRFIHISHSQASGTLSWRVWGFCVIELGKYKHLEKQQCVCYVSDRLTIFIHVYRFLFWKTIDFVFIYFLLVFTPNFWILVFIYLWEWCFMSYSWIFLLNIMVT